MTDKLIIAGYGIFLIIGAYFGFKAGSRISLIMGLASGLLVFLGLYLSSINARNGFLFLTILGSFLSCLFIVRFLKTQHFMPSGMLMFISSIFTLFCAIRFLRL